MSSRPEDPLKDPAELIEKEGRKKKVRGGSQDGDQARRKRENRLRLGSMSVIEVLELDLS